MKPPIKSALGFAKKFRNILEDHSKTQRQIANECAVSSSAINRLCKDGTGSENHICLVLKKFNLKRRRIVEILTDRRAELGLPLFYVPVVMRVYHTYSPCLEEGGA